MPNFLSGMPLGGLATLIQGGGIKDVLKNSIPLSGQLGMALLGNTSLSPAFSSNMGFLGLNQDKQRQGQTAQPMQYANTKMGQMEQFQPQGQYTGTQALNPYYQQYQIAQQAMNPQGGM